MKVIGICLLLFCFIGCKKKIATVQEIKDELKAFVIEINDIKRSRNYEALMSQFISKEEFEDFYNTYGYSRSFSTMKYNKIVRIPSVEDFEYIFKSKPGGYYDCPGDYVFSKDPKQEIVVASELFEGLTPEPNKPEAEYYFCEEVFEMECSELTEGYSYKMSRRHKIGELIYIPQKGWRLTNGF